MSFDSALTRMMAAQDHALRSALSHLKKADEALSHRVADLRCTEARDCARMAAQHIRDAMKLAGTSK